MANPNPLPPPVENRWKPGQSGNPKGKPKGRRSLAIIVRDLLENEDFDWSKVPIKNKSFAEKFKIAWEAIVATAVAKSMSGDTKAMEWLRKSGYGDKLDVTTDGQKIGFTDEQADRVLERMLKKRKAKRSE